MMSVERGSIMANTLFSILVPVYNVESYIREALDSILAQESNDYEVILIDDGSTDSSGSICDEYQNKYPDKFFVTHKKNEGLIAARREGIRQAKGVYSVFLDSDDMLEKNCLHKLREIINSQKDLDVVIYGFSYLYMDTQQKVPGATVFKELEPFAYENISSCYNLSKTALYFLKICNFGHFFLYFIHTLYSTFIDSTYSIAHCYIFHTIHQ